MITHKFLILGEDPPTCSLCQNLLTMKRVLFDCAGFNPVRFFFKCIKPNTGASQKI